MLSSWYLACDMQLYVISICLISLIWVMQNRIKSIFAISLFVAILVPAAITYYHKLMPVFLIYPENIRQTFYNEETFMLTYIKSYTNFGAYIIGIITAYLISTGKLQAALKLSPSVNITRAIKNAYTFVAQPLTFFPVARYVVSCLLL